MGVATPSTVKELGEPAIISRGVSHGDDHRLADVQFLLNAPGEGGRLAAAAVHPNVDQVV